MIKACTRCGISTLAMLAGACTTQISTLPDVTMTPPQAALPGTTYNLPMLQYRIEVTRTLSNCPTTRLIPAADGSSSQRELFVDPTLTFDVKVVATSQYVRGESYVVDYRSLSNLFKQTGFGFANYPETGNLKSINVSADDRTGDVLKDVASVGLTVAALAGGGPLAGAAMAPAVLRVGASDTGGGGVKGLAAKPVKQINAEDDAALYELAGRAIKRSTFIDCAQSAREALAARESSAKEVKAATAALTAITARVRNGTLVAGVRGLSPTVKAGYAATLAKDLSALDQAQTVLEAKTLAKGKADAMLLETSPRVWPERLSDRAGPLNAPEKVRDAFTSQMGERPAQASRVLDVHGFAVLLAAFRVRQPERFERLAARYAYLRSYLLPNGASPPKPSEGPSACKPGDPSLDVSACLTASLQLAMRLDTVEMNGGRFLEGGCAGLDPEFPTLDCRKMLELPTSGVSGGRVTGGSGRSATLGSEVVDAWEFRNGEAVPKGGVFIRQPVRARLLVCRGATCDANTSENLLVVDPKAAPTFAPQLGQLRFLPFRNVAFQSNELALELAADGTIAKFEYRDKAAIAAGMAATAAAIAKQADDDRTKRRDEAAKARTQGVADLQAEIDAHEKEARLIELRTPKTADQLAADREIADLKARTALLDAKFARQKAHNDLLAAGGRDD